MDHRLRLNSEVLARIQFTFRTANHVKDCRECERLNIVPINSKETVLLCYAPILKCRPPCCTARELRNVLEAAIDISVRAQRKGLYLQVSERYTAKSRF